MTKKDLALLKSALRRAFSRSDLRKEALEASIVVHSDPTRPKVKTWCKCTTCGKLDAKSYMEVDHYSPFVPLDKTFADLTEAEMIRRMWCPPENLKAVCEACHNGKTSVERKQRAAHRALIKAALKKQLSAL